MSPSVQGHLSNPAGVATSDAASLAAALAATALAAARPSAALAAADVATLLRPRSECGAMRWQPLGIGVRSRR